MTNSFILKIILLSIPDMIIIIYLSGIYFYKNKISAFLPGFIYYGIIIIFFAKLIIFFYFYNLFLQKTIKGITSIINDLKKGKFISINKIIRKDQLTKIHNELILIGNYMNSTISTLKDEIKNLRELYNNIVLSISSYLIILNKKKEIIFLNDIFCKKFQFELDEVILKTIDDIFFFVSDKFKNSIEEISNYEDPIVLEKTHLLSKNWISIIADIKISSITVQNEEQIILIIDDITSRCRKDYQINLITQVTESIQRDEEIHRILYTILFGITSGAGLGFNRAMLFLSDQKRKFLIGEMAVGPDSLEEAIDIWNSMPSGSVDISNLTNTFNNPERKGRQLLDKVIKAKFDIESENVLVRPFKNKKSIHVYDSWNDKSIDEEIKKFIDVTEFVVVPLILENKVIGIIVADNKFNQVPIGNDHIELLSIFAVQASLLIESYHSVSTLKKEMTKVKNRQEALIESEKMAAIGRISSHIAHEIRNPLVTMGGYARRIKQISQENENVNRAADVILKETERLESILSNVMDLTKPQALIKKLNNLNDIVNDTFDLMKNVFQEKKIKVTKKLNEDIPLFNSDFNQLKQVILNLLQNSIDSTPQLGKIEIITDILDDNVILRIKDTGTGIEDEKIENIFEPFYTTKVTGVGLGLAIVNKIVKDHNAAISVRNRESSGAEFEIKFPI